MNAFTGGNEAFRAARDRCATACMEFNEKAEKVTLKEKAALWLKIVSPGSDAATMPTLEQAFASPNIKPQISFVKGPIFIDYGLRVRIGGSTFINRGCKILDTPVADVVIGEGCLLGPDVTIISVSHPLRAEDRAEAKTGRPASYGERVQVGDDVWIGAGVIILPGVTIGSGAVIGSSSIVTSDIPPKTLAVGSPAKVIRSLENEQPRAVAGIARTLEEALRLG